MKTLLISALMALVPGLVMASGAPVTTKAPAKTTAQKAAAKSATKARMAKVKAKTKTPHKVIVAKAQSSTSPVRAASVVAPAAAAGLAAGAVAANQVGNTDVLAIADRVYVGRIACELGAHVTVTADSTAPGHFHVEGKNFKYYMSPVATSTGTVRLEDTKAGAVWLQIANKSMLMNQKLGQRLADECMSSEQVVVAEAIKRNPPPSVLDPLPAGK
ncbi:MAG: hypothetical protein K2X65_04760 [Burkholderiaceae bacterium]|jgi:hypothetical protein|nr:hypothetical protein [Burkholderiaceae bacterium]